MLQFAVSWARAVFALANALLPHSSILFVGKMRILALHPSGSSADDLQHSLRDLDDGLRTKHGIELVYVDAPLLSSPPGKCSEIEKKLNGDGFDSPSKRRCWFDADLNGSSRRCGAPGTSDGTAIQYVGLDASILHLSQIWNRRVHSNPFSGIISLGQSAAISALLPLLVRPVLTNEMEDGGGVGDEQAKAKDNDEKDGVNLGVPLFPGLDFVVLVDGFDITANRTESKKMTSDDIPWFDQSTPAPESLHIVSQQGAECREAMARRLAKRYGESAQIHCRTCTTECDANIPSGNESESRYFYDEGIVQPLRKRELNVIGRFLVSQKNTLARQSVARTIDNADDSFNTKQLAKRMQDALVIKETRRRLGMLEEEAERALVEHVSANPPRALMAVIAPDVVGAWSGPKWRSPDMDGGGAPCPAEFRRKEGKRGGGGSDEEDNDVEGTTSKILYEREEGEARKTFADQGIGRQHPSAL